MQPTTNTITSRSARRRVRDRHRALIAVGALALSSLLAACGGSSDSSATSDGGGDEVTTTAATDGSSGGDTTTTTEAGASDLDVCAEVTKDDMAAILTEADLTEVTTNEAITAPNCRYSIEISGGGTTITADVATIVWSDPTYFDGQKELQTDEVDLPDVGADAFSIVDGNTIFVRGATGTFVVDGGVELTEGGTAASTEQLTAIAKLLVDL